MNYYLVPTEIAEALGLQQLRKSTPGGMFLLSESDLVPYGVERAINEGAIEVSNRRRPTPAQESAALQTPAQETHEGPTSEESPSEGEEESPSEDEESPSEEEQSPSEEEESPKEEEE
ncbi:MAG: hypothetical protein IJT48_07720 [Bacteroidaceae bacterium]|nr:hypothetical protein [Bacteroidaceae bacterium]